MRYAVGAAIAVAFAAVSPGAKAQDLKIPFTKTTLPNGLVVILSEDHVVPRVVVDTTYVVGSRMEKAGRTGFAHLFEHLMFMGTRRAPRGAFDDWMAQAGGYNNAGTGEDHTEYYDVAASTALPLLLWLEADRMHDLGHLIDQEKLDLQREVVLNERRQTIENRPYGLTRLEIPKLLWPEGHPYHHAVIGSPEDLRAAALGDVKDFFATWYDPANASLVVAGDFDSAKAKGDIERYFASVPSRGKPIDPGTGSFDEAKTALTSVKRETVTDNITLPRVVIAWQSPRHFAAGDAELDLLASVLGSGQESRLSEALVYQQKVAKDVAAHQDSGALGSTFEVVATARDGVDPAVLEKALLEQVAKVRTQAVTEKELERAQNGYETGFVDGLQRVETRATLLNSYQAELGDADYVQRDLDRYRHATAADILKYAAKVLSPNALVVLTIVPKTAGKP